jgi:hypothetical protein
MKSYGEEFSNEENKARAENISSISEQKILQQASDILTPELAEEIKLVWEDEGIQKVYQLKSEYNLLDSANYFLNQISTIGNPKYQPTQQDILRTRQKTVGIVETDFKIDNRRVFFIFSETEVQIG